MAAPGKKASEKPSTWQKLIVAWKAEQAELIGRLRVEALDPLPRMIAGADAAFSSDKNSIFAVATLYDRERRTIVEVARVHQPVEVPYIPGFLSFREGPAVLAALRSLKGSFGAIFFDGQGLAHPRRCGLATHLSVTLDVPGVGVAKSRLIGTFDEPPPAAGESSPLMDRGEQIGLVLRTKAATRPLFVSVGHRVDLESARRLVMACCNGYRIPEPTRQADIEVARFKRDFEKAKIR